MAGHLDVVTTMCADSVSVPDFLRRVFSFRFDAVREISIPALLELAAAFVALAGLGLLLAGAGVAWQVQRRLRTRERLPAQIVAWEVDDDGFESSHYPVFAFRTPDGVWRQRRSVFPVHPWRVVPVGSPAVVLCDPAHPEAADLESSGLPYIAAVVLAALGGPLLLIGGMLFLVGFLAPRLR